MRSAHVLPPLAVNSKSERKVNSLPPLGFELVIIGMLAHLSNHSTKSHPQCSHHIFLTLKFRDSSFTFAPRSLFTLSHHQNNHGSSNKHQANRQQSGCCHNKFGPTQQRGAFANRLQCCVFCRAHRRGEATVTSLTHSCMQRGF
jgi:hypothetical protein